MTLLQVPLGVGVDGVFGMYRRAPWRRKARYGNLANTSGLSVSSRLTGDVGFNWVPRAASSKRLSFGEGVVFFLDRWSLARKRKAGDGKGDMTGYVCG